MFIGILLVLNIPVFLFIGWLAFDTKGNAADSLFHSIIGIIKMLLIPNFLWALMGMDSEEGLSLLQLGGLSVACTGIIYGEYYLIHKFIGG